MTTQRSLKRRRIDDGDRTIASDSSREGVRSPLVSLQRDVSPPARSSSRPKDDIREVEADGGEIVEWVVDEEIMEEEEEHGNERKEERKDDESSTAVSIGHNPTVSVDVKEKGSLLKIAPQRLIPSPIQLTRIRDLPPSANKDTLSLHDILGHPLLAECWQFNYLHSIPFITSHFDADIRAHVTLKIVHGFWRNDDPRKLRLQEEAATAIAQDLKVDLLAAHMPEMFGTHHSKMMVLLRRDGVAQVVIHTANMIPQDWGNMTQGVWRSPELNLLTEEEQREWREDERKGKVWPLGSGRRFKADLLEYLRAYAGRTRSLVEELAKYDFSSIRAALIASTPSKVSSDSQSTTAWGWPGLRQILSQIPSSRPQETPVINIQISSIATLTEKWIKDFLSLLNTTKKTKTPLSLPFAAKEAKAKHNIIFPTPAEIRQSLDGYVSGASIHWKLQSVAQQKQLRLLKPMLCHWDSSIHTRAADEGRREALRNRAAPHIKTYLRFTDTSCKHLDWALLTSANLSQQAWGFSADGKGTVRIASYEIGVVVWPALFKENEEEEIVMVPTFGEDMPSAGEEGKTVVGFRMPYDLPLGRYEEGDVPWCATMGYEEPDWMGRVQRAS